MYYHLDLPRFPIASIRVVECGDDLQLSLLLGRFKVEKTIDLVTIKGWALGGKITKVWAPPIPYLKEDQNKIDGKVDSILEDLIAANLTKRSPYWAIAEYPDKELAVYVNGRSEIGKVVIFVRKHKNNIVAYRLPIGEPDPILGQIPKKRKTDLKKVKIR